MRIVMIGATGLVGRAVAPLLVREHELTILGRRAATIAGAIDIVAPIASWGAPLPGPVDVAVCTLGTTLKQAGSVDAFRAVDETAVLAFAHSARAAGARHFIFISSVGADPTGPSGYLRVKGVVEASLAEIGFERLDLVRPGLLLGDRGNDRRAGERIARALSPLARLVLRGSLGRFAAIDATVVAKAIARLASATAKGRFIHHNSELVALAP